MTLLETSGYVYDHDRRIWFRPGYAGIAYNDGDEHERRLAEIVRHTEDRSIFSAELATHCTDWPSLYHLSAHRANILRPFENDLKGKVLEIGAGCGAITRYLGELGADVLALEGSPRRAAIAADRTRELPNVTVLAERFDDFRTDQKFDAITLIGVLEYASMFSGGDNPAVGMLARVRELLKPTGRLFIAIENQLGLKYFAGAPEDHLGQPMYGIEGRYRLGQPQTFGRQQLRELLHHSGFEHAHFLAPFPDYKLPVSIVTEAGFKYPRFDASVFAWQSVARDPQLPIRTHFSLPLAWPVIVENGLGLELANSFLVVASPAGEAFTSDVLAYHYSTDRKAPYCKETLFIATPDDDVSITYRRLATDARADNDEFCLVLPPSDRYVMGRPLSVEFLELTASPNWTVAQAAELLNRYVGLVQRLAGNDTKAWKADDLLPGSYIDAVPQNIIVDSNDQVHLIDREWARSRPIELGYLVFRALLWMVGTIRHPVPDEIAHLTRAEVVIRIMKAAGFTVSRNDLERFDQLDEAFQRTVVGPMAARGLQVDQRSMGAIAGSSSAGAVLYFGNETEGFSEARSLYRPVRLGRQRIEFEIGRDAGSVTSLRCDPIDRPAFLIVYALEAYDSDNRILFSVKDSCDNASVVGLEPITRLNGCIILRALDHDPQINLPFLAGSDSVARVVLDLEVLDDVQIAAVLSETSRSLSDARKRADTLAGQLHLAQGQLSEAKVGMATAEANLAKTHKQLTRARSELENVRTELENMRAKLSEMRAAFDEARSSANRRVELMMQEAAQELASVKERLAEASAIAQQLDQAVAAMRSSRSWQMTRPVRYLGRVARLGRNASRIGIAVWKRDGNAQFARKVVGIWQREGVRGLVNRVRTQGNASHPVPTAVPVPAQDQPIKFSPAALARGQDGKYALLPSSDGYVYIPPQKPDDLQTQIARMKRGTLFSIVVPVYNTAPELLSALLQSVQSQWYENWELILVDDASPSKITQRTLSEISDPRIRVIRLEANSGISGATNEGIAVARGDYIVFLDHDDELTADCLYELALCIERDDPDFAYSDEDKLTEEGHYTQPHFKPDWSPDTMMSTMFTCHVSCVRRSLALELGGLRSNYDGCQDWDFVLRLSERTNRISHIPKVLYHWRIIPASTAADIAAKPYVLDASRRVREAALERRGLQGRVEAVAQVPGYFRVNYALQGEPLISIVIPTRDNEKVLRRCIDSIRRLTSYRRYELVVLDNGSVDVLTVAYLNELSSHDDVTVVPHDAPFNFSELNNIGARAARGDLLLFLNDDTEVIAADWLERLGGYAQLPHVGAVGAKLLYPGGKQVQHAGVLNLRNGPVHAFLHESPDAPGYFMRNLLEYNWLAVTGACLMVDRKKFEQVGGFSEVLPVAYNDVDLCFRLVDAGFYNVVCQAVRLLHHESASRGLDHASPEKLERLWRDLKLLYERNPEYFERDPFHNRNLHPNGLNFEVPA